MDPTPSSACAACGELLKPESRFCARCGHRRGDPASPAVRKPSLTDVLRKTDAGLKDIRFVLVFYGLLLLSVAAGMILNVAGMEDAPAMLASTLLLSAVTLGAACRRPTLVTPLYKAAGPLWGYLLIPLASVPVFLGVHLFVEGVAAAFRMKTPGFLEEFGDWPLVWVFALGAAAPAVVEELGFRGLVFGLLRRRLTLAEAFLISSAAFAILHLSIPSLVTHLPMGLYFCWLRHRSNSLWPPMLAHALHNSWVILYELRQAA